MKDNMPQICLSEVTGEVYISYKGELIPVTKEIVYAVYRSEKAMRMLNKILEGTQNER